MGGWSPTTIPLSNRVPQSNAKQVGLSHRGKAQIEGGNCSWLYTLEQLTQVADFPQGKQPKWSRENSQPVQAGVTHPMTWNVDHSSRHFSAPNNLMPWVAGTCRGQSLRDPCSKMGSGSSWGLREGIALGWGQPATGTDSWLAGQNG